MDNHGNGDAQVDALTPPHSHVVCGQFGSFTKKDLLRAASPTQRLFHVGLVFVSPHVF